MHPNTIILSYATWEWIGMEYRLISQRSVCQAPIKDPYLDALETLHATISAVSSRVISEVFVPLSIVWSLGSSTEKAPKKKPFFFFFS